jgi:hypothetical protein
MIGNGSSELPKVAPKFCCNFCDYNTSKKSSYEKHLTTDKHKKIVNDSNLVEKLAKKSPKVAQTQTQYQCECGKIYSWDSGYYRHKKKCDYIPQNNDSQNKELQIQQFHIMLELIKDDKNFKDFMMEQNKQMMEQNKQMMEQMMELAKQAGHNTTHTNSHNTNKFNIQLFLNEKCKNALNITDFVEQLQVGIKDLEETGRLGFSEGISKIFINGLNQIELYLRPLHCNDAKRETLYIKNDDKWTKEEDTKPILTKAIKQVAYKNMKQISEWQKINTDYSDPESKQNDKYLQIVSESMSGSTKEECDKNYDKIIKKLVKETVIPNTEK